MKKMLLLTKLELSGYKGQSLPFFNNSVNYQHQTNTYPMGIKQKLFSNMFLRNMFASFGNRSAYTHDPGSFEPYFQYKIGGYQRDYYLYFPKEPFAIRYYNEIFNKLHEYKRYDIVRFLEFHYSAYADHGAFLRFLNYEINARLKNQPNDSELLTAQAWVIERTNEFRKNQKTQIRQEVEGAIQDLVTSQPAISPVEVEKFVTALVEKFTDHMERLTAETERGIKGLTSSFVAGNVELNNRNHEEKLMQFFVLFRDVTAPLQVSKAESLFKRFTDSDVAAILRLHFAAFKDNKINTLQHKIGDQKARIRPDNPRVKKLNEALQGFFY